MTARGRTLTGLLLSLCLLAPAGAGAQGSQSQNTCVPAGRDLSEKVRRQREIECLLPRLRDERLRRSDPEQVFKAMRRLGELRAVTAIDDLTKLLTLKRVFDWETPENAGRTGIEETIIMAANRYPAVDALISIGKPALPSLVEVIGSHESGSLESENAVFAVFMILEARPEKAAEFLRRAAAQSHSHEAARRLLAASKNRLLSPTQPGR
jgi:hypothetical protein